MERVVDEGIGQPIIVVHGGMGDSSTWVRVTDLLRDQFRVIRIHRRQYQLDHPRPVTIADEVEQVNEIAAELQQAHQEPAAREQLNGIAARLPQAHESPSGREQPSGTAAGAEQANRAGSEQANEIAEGLEQANRTADGIEQANRTADGLEQANRTADGLERVGGGLARRDGRERPILVGHSSGAVVVLEALAARPELYGGAVLYEPPLVLDEPLGGDQGRIDEARAALARNRPDLALGIFLRAAVGMGPVKARLFGATARMIPHGREMVERQLDDNDAINAVGNRLASYAKVDLRVLLLGGDKSPRHLARRLDALQQALPRAQRITMHGQGHNAERTAPDRVAAAIRRFSLPTRS